ncbi:MAG: lysophospholipid acyltransferase family protein [Cyanobacteria bacterium]|nr:lysophospholipid acyltransferase family protein [Cyanobacteriota bacterium]MDA1245758.1 lysophospholipid acyltransferase family protein [Cyanobacteriota bacterium]
MSSLAGAVLNGYAELVFRTSRIRIQAHPDTFQLVREQGAVIYAFWHRHAFFISLLRRFDRRRVAVLISSHRDGQIVAVAVRLRGMEVVEGSSTRGGLQAYRSLRRALQQCQPVCITPDGPKGPAEVVKIGVINLAQQSGCPIVAVSVSCSRSLRLRSWDQSVLPLPLSRLVMQLGEPLWLHNGSPDCQELLAERLRQEARLAAE